MQRFAEQAVSEKSVLTSEFYCLAVSRRPRAFYLHFCGGVSLLPVCRDCCSQLWVPLFTYKITLTRPGGFRIFLLIALKQLSREVSVFEEWLLN